MRFIFKLLFVLELFALGLSSQQDLTSVPIAQKLPLLSMIRSFGFGQTSAVKAEATRLILQLYKTKLAIEKKMHAWQQFFERFLQWSLLIGVLSSNLVFKKTSFFKYKIMKK